MTIARWEVSYTDLKIQEMAWTLVKGREKHVSEGVVTIGVVTIVSKALYLYFFL